MGLAAGGWEEEGQWDSHWAKKYEFDAKNGEKSFFLVCATSIFLFGWCVRACMSECVRVRVSECEQETLDDSFVLTKTY